MTRRAYLYFLVTIILGAILGGLGVYYFMWDTGRIQHPHVPNSVRVEHLRKVLDLTDAQAQDLRRILDDSGQKMRDLQKQIDPQFQAIRMETRGRIRQILNPEQQKKFDDFVKAIDDRHRQHGAPPPPAR